MEIVLLLLAVFSFSASFADETPGSHIFKFSENIEVQTQNTENTDGDEIVFLKNGKEMGCSFSGDAGTSLFRDITEVHLKGTRGPLFVSEWTEGAHNFRITIINPEKKEKCALKSFDGPYLIKYSAEGDHLRIQLIQPGEIEKESKNKIVNWKP